MKIGERILLALSRHPAARDYPGGTIKTDFDNALDFLCKTTLRFKELVHGKTVLDFGCGWGWQAVAMVKQAGAQRVVGVDIRGLERARALAEQHGVADRVVFQESLPAEPCDVVVSSSSIEHLADPVAAIRQMTQAVRPGGRIVVSWAEPWYSPHGSHMNFFTRVPWVNLLFSESTVMRVRSRFRSDGATRYEEIEGGLNRMTLAKFDRLIRSSDLIVEFLKYYPTKGIPLVAHIPLLQELLVSAVGCVLQRPEATGTLSNSQQ